MGFQALYISTLVFGSHMNSPGPSGMAPPKPCKLHLLRSIVWHLLTVH
jgi:hypothetical protein